MPTIPSAVPALLGVLPFYLTALLCFCPALLSNPTFALPRLARALLDSFPLFTRPQCRYALI